MTLKIANLGNLKPGTFFKSGYFTKHGQVFRWVAVAGAIGDWAIYFYNKGKTDSWIHDFGNKLYDIDMIKKLVLCTDEALKNYRR